MLNDVQIAGLLGSIGLSLTTSLALFLYGKRLPRGGDWLAGTALSVTLMSVLLIWTGLESWQFNLSDQLRGWLGSQGVEGGLRVGVLVDTPGFVFIILAVLLGTLTLVVSQNPIIYAASLVGSASVMLAWLASTPWVSFVALGLSIFGGMAVFSELWSEDDEAGLATAWTIERLAGVVIALMGALVLTSSGVKTVWPQPNELGVDWAESSVVGVGLLLSGLGFQFHPFPFLAWLVRDSRQKILPRIILTQIFPALVAASFFFRISPALYSHGVQEFAGWIALILAMMSVLAGLFQKDWSKSLMLWISAGMLLSVSALFLAGTWEGLGTLGGVTLTGALFSLTGSGNQEMRAAPKWRAQLSRSLIFFAALMGSGFIGFVSAGSFLSWYFKAFDKKIFLISVAAAVGIFSLLSWRIFWILFRKDEAHASSLISLLLGGLILLLSLGVFWTGSLSGGAIPFGWDRLFVTVFTDVPDLIYTPEAEEIFYRVSWFYWGSMCLSIILAYWSSGRVRDQFGNWGDRSGLGRFIAGGYGQERLLRGIGSGVIDVSERIVLAIDQKVWEESLPKSAYYFATQLSGVMERLNRSVQRMVETAVRTSVVVPGKVLQLVQSGDVRWYAIFAIGSVIAILINFLKHISI